MKTVIFDVANAYGTRVKEVTTEEVVEDNNKKGYSDLHYVDAYKAA